MGEKKKLGEMLIEAGVIARSQLQAALNYQHKWGGKLGEALIAIKAVDENSILGFFSKNFNLPSLNISEVKTIASETINTITYHMAVKLAAIPLSVKTQDGQKRLYVAVPDPTNQDVISEIERHARIKVVPVVVTYSGIRKAIDRFKTTFKDYDPSMTHLLQKAISGPPGTAEGSGGGISIDESAGVGETMTVFRGGGEEQISQDNSRLLRASPNNLPPPPKITSIWEDNTPTDLTQSKEMKLVKSLLKLLVRKGVLTRDELTELINEIK